MSEPPVGIISYRKIQIRRDTATAWGIDNPILDLGEPGWDETNRVLKIGDGTTRWASLAGLGGGGGSGSGVTVSETAPVSPTGGDMWFNPADGSLNLFYSGVWIQV